MVDAPGLVDVEPDDAADIESLHSVEQARDLGRPAGILADGGLGDQDRLGGERPHVLDRLAEDAVERAVTGLVVAVNAASRAASSSSRRAEGVDNSASAPSPSRC